MKSLLLLFCLPSVIFAEYFRVCYVTNWSQYRQGIAKYDISKNYQHGLCTHLIFAFAKIEDKGNNNFVIAPVEHNDQTIGYQQTQGLKSRDPNLKTMLSVGGYTFGSKLFSKMVKTKASRKSFITSAVSYLKNWGFDGLDLDWEFPAKRDGSSPEDKPNFSKLCKELKQQFSKEGLIVSAAVIGESRHVEESYDIAEIFKHLDFVNVMAYDLNGSWQKNANHHTDTNPMHQSSLQSMDSTVQTYIRLGADPEKMVLGIASYGRTSELVDACHWRLSSKTTGESGRKGIYTGQGGLLAYYEICQMKVEGRVCTKDSQAFAPFASKGTDFINYDDEESVALKVNRLVKRKDQKDLKGIMIWTLDFDDFNGVCKTGKYPLWQAAIDALVGKETTYTSCTHIEKPCSGPVATSSLNTGEYVRVCYITNWSQYRQGLGKFDASEHYEPGICTHMIYAFANLEKKTNGFAISPSESNDQYLGYPKANHLKSRDTKLKILLSVRGVFSELIKTKESRATFIQNALQYIQSYKFDGLDLSVQSPTTDDKPNFTKLCQELKEVFSKHSLLVTQAFPPSQIASYEVKEISKHLDFINVMSYDVPAAKASTTSHHANMNPDAGQSLYTIINDLLSKGAAPNKLVLGIPLFAKTAKLTNKCKWDLGSSTNGTGVAGAYTKQSGILAYYEVCKLSWNNRVCTESSTVSSPYGDSVSDFIAYDDEKSVANKIQKITIQKQLKGVMFWSLEYEDFSNNCNTGKYPIVKAAIRSLKGLAVTSQCRNERETSVNCQTTGEVRTTRATTTVKPDKEYIRVCYFTNWAQYRTGVAKYDATKHYEKGLCTHIMYAFAKVKPDTFELAPYEWNDLTTEYKKVIALKEEDPNLKILLSVGGWTHGSEGFTEMVKTSANRKTFIDSAKKFLLIHNFDGIDIDWEYPARRKGHPEDKENFSEFLKEIKQVFSVLDLLVTVAVDGKIKDIDTSYEVAKISQNVDFISIMSYDFTEPTEPKTAHHTDMTKNSGSSKETVYNTIDAWISKGADVNKLVLGLAAYGKTMALEGTCSALGVATQEKGGSPGLFTKSSGLLAYYEICKSTFKSRVCTKSSSVDAPYGSMIYGDDFISYDDPESIALKVQNVMIAKKMKGFLFWTLDLDDFANQCGFGTYPLIKTAKNIALGLGRIQQDCTDIQQQGCTTPIPIEITSTEIPTTTTEATTTTTETTTTTTESTTTTTESTTTTALKTTTTETPTIATTETPETTEIPSTTKSTTTTSTTETPTTAEIPSTTKSTTTTDEASTIANNTTTDLTTSTTETPTTATTKVPTTTTAEKTPKTVEATTTTTTTAEIPATTKSTTTTTKAPVIITDAPTTTSTTTTTSSTATTTTTTPTTLAPTVPKTVSPGNFYSRVCYFTDTAVERPGVGSFDILKNLEKDLCTHLVYADGNIEQLGFGTIFKINVIGFKSILNQLKLRDSSLNVMLGFGSSEANVNSLKILMNAQDVRQRFFQYAATYLKNYGFDGIDVTWTPAANEPKNLRFKFTTFCRELKHHFHAHGLLVTATLSGDMLAIDRAYEVDKISQNLDFINVITYNFHTSPNQIRYAAHHTDSRYSTNSYDETVHNTIKHWLLRGAHPKKLVLGLATFGKTFELKRPESHWTIGSSVYIGGGLAGNFTQTKGKLAYYEVCKMSFQSRQCTQSSLVKAPFGSDGKTFIAYDDPESVQYKIRDIMINYKLKGFMVSDLDFDDFNDVCGYGSYPLLKAARDASRTTKKLQFSCTDKIYIPPPTTSTTTTQRTTRKKPGNPGEAGSSGVQIKNTVATYLLAFMVVAKLILC